ncbi:hypothetical protein DQ04_00661210 [Trypanosoma grayi]|uniref:hypothetical protein n=1 Tax=Trypanosoma grayi TaxID=71804 RepID=UPI0004F448F1|nr:hypothetical protein DQ04_00661210 [Trypanosoma grayi]KEG14043.1 hypothetical protein DQ04_00661210 [Trypanosoma grayi]
MAAAPRYHYEPPPRLYVGVDYRRDPLFFRIPSPRGPVGGMPCESPHQQRLEEGALQSAGATAVAEAPLPAVVHDSPNRTSRGKMAPDCHVQKQQEGAMNSSSDSPKIPRLEVPGRDNNNNHGAVWQSDLLSPRALNKRTSCHPSASVHNDTRGRKSEAIAAAAQRPRARSAALGSEALSRLLNDGAAHTPRLTRSAILRREFNASHTVNGDSFQSPCGTSSRYYFNVQRISQERRGGNPIHSKGAGVLLEGTSICTTIGLEAGYSSGRVRESPSWDDKSSPREASASANARVVHTRGRLGGAETASGRVKSSRQFTRTDRATRAPLSAVDRNRQHSRETLKEREGVPPVPELRDIVLRLQRTRGVGVRNDTVQADGAAQSSVTRVGTKTQPDPDILYDQTMEEGREPSDSALDRQNVPPVGEDILSLTDIVRESDVTVLSDNAEELNDGDAQEDEYNHCCIRGGDNDVDVVASHESQDSAVNPDDAKPPCEGVEVTSDRGASGPREGTVPPVDMVEAVYDFSSDAFSEETDVTPHSLSGEERDVSSPPPSYWREETLPMVEAKAACSSPSELSAEDDMPQVINPGRWSEGRATATGSPDAVASVGTLSSLSGRELKERVASIPRFLIVEYAATRKVRPARLPTSTTLPKYMALRRRVQLDLLGEFFRDWRAWSTRSMTARRVGERRTDRLSDGNAVHSACPAAAAQTAAPVGNIAPQETQHVVWVDPTEERCATPAGAAAPLKEKKSPPPLSSILLERARIQENSCQYGGPNRATGAAHENTDRSESSSFCSTLSTAKGEISGDEDGSPLAGDGGRRVADVQQCRPPRPSTPVNCTSQGMEGMRSHTSSPSRDVSRESSEEEEGEESKRTVDIGELSPITEEQAAPPHRIKYYHFDF